MFWFLLSLSSIFYVITFLQLQQVRALYILYLCMCRFESNIVCKKVITVVEKIYSYWGKFERNFPQLYNISDFSPSYIISHCEKLKTNVPQKKNYFCHIWRKYSVHVWLSPLPPKVICIWWESSLYFSVSAVCTYSPLCLRDIAHVAWDQGSQTWLKTAWIHFVKSEVSPSSFWKQPSGEDDRRRLKQPNKISDQWWNPKFLNKITIPLYRSSLFADSRRTCAMTSRPIASRPMTTGLMTTRPMENSSPRWQFAPWTTFPLDNSPHGQLAP
jgi:hypothetical protein